MTSEKDVDLEYSLASLWAKKWRENWVKGLCIQEFYCCGTVLLRLSLPWSPRKGFWRSEEGERWDQLKMTRERWTKINMGLIRHDGNER